MLNKDNNKLEKENTKLKELLKECRFLISEIPLIRKIDENDEMLRGRFLTYRKICEKIDQVLGE